MKTVRLNRRQILELCISRGMLLGATALSHSQLLAAWQQAEATANKPTPAEVLGPFFRKGAPDNRLLRAAGDAGFPLKVAGKVMDTRGSLIEGAKVDFWHADHHGLYDTRGYRYRTKLSPDSQGVYTVETVMPGHYSDRPAQHIHYLISAPGHKTLITQAYFATDPFFDGDANKNWKKRNIVSNRDLVLPVRLFEGNDKVPAHAEITFDIILEKA